MRKEAPAAHVAASVANTAASLFNKVMPLSSSDNPLSDSAGYVLGTVRGKQLIHELNRDAPAY